MDALSPTLPPASRDDSLTVDSAAMKRASVSLTPLNTSRAVTPAELGLMHRRRDSVSGPSPYDSPKSQLQQATRPTLNSGFDMKITLGVCCMAKKLKQGTMVGLLETLEESGNFEIVRFEEKLILEQPVDDWPTTDCMIAFFSSGFPLEKAIAYANMHPHTFFLTDPASQRVLLDRRDFYYALKLNNIPTAPHVFCNRDGYRGSGESVLVEERDYIVVDGIRVDKPFVEKPADSEDHNIRIYFHSREGGGARFLFRKIGDKSSEFHPKASEVRRDGSFVYERYIEPAGLMDVKCYTVGPTYVHAECRKAPAVDGVVDRDASGKEHRENITLTPDEQMVARKITKVFRQLVCGFDILRSVDGSFYVCDVNGWSFVKKNPRYVATAAAILRELFETKVRERGLHRVIQSKCAHRRLKGMVCIARHADRTPKQKIKVFVPAAPFVATVLNGNEQSREEVTVKAGDPRLGDIARYVDRLLEELQKVSTPLTIRRSDSLDSDLGDLLSVDVASRRRAKNALALMKSVLCRNDEGLKIQVKPALWDIENRCTEVQLVCKWGGWLTEAGELQAKTLGSKFNTRVYSRFDSRTSSDEGSSMSVRSTAEQRVIQTAVAFTQTFSGNSNFSSKDVHVDTTVLGDTIVGKESMSAMIETIDHVLHLETGYDELLETIPPLRGVVECVCLPPNFQSPLGALNHLRQLIADLVDHLAELPDSTMFARSESAALVRERWENKFRSYLQGPKKYDTSKLPDIFDFVSYDVCYNQQALAPLDLYPLFILAEALSRFVTWSEFGFSQRDRQAAAAAVAAPLVRCIRDDVRAIADGNGPPTRLYFTSESHVHALKNILYGSSVPFHDVGIPLELNFLSHFVFKVYEYEPEGSDSKDTLVEVHFSSGVDKNMFGIDEGHHMQYAAVAPTIRIHNQLSLSNLDRVVDESTAIHSEKRAVEPKLAEHYFRDAATRDAAVGEIIDGFITP